MPGLGGDPNIADARHRTRCHQAGRMVKYAACGYRNHHYPGRVIAGRRRRGHVEEHLGARELMERGFSEELVRRVLKLVVQSEYKRRQAAPALRVTARAFGEGWRFPIAHGYRH